MKKLFTLALVLLVATIGYSQVRNVSRNNDFRQVSTMQVYNGMESLEFVQSEPNMTRSDGELDYTTYDWQSNCGNITRTIVWPDGKINFAYTIAGDNSYTDRGTGIGTYDSEADEWIPLGGRIENEKTGFGSIARYKENGIVIASHNANTVVLFIVEDKDQLTDLQGTVAAINSIPDNNGIEPTWANVMTSGPNRDIIHVLYTSYGQTGNPMYYARSMDGGNTWDKLDVVIPFLSDEYFSDWGANIAYWMETTEDNCLAFVVNNAWSDGMVIYSYDDGETWERKVYYHHPGINTDMTDHIVLYPRWASAQWGIGGELCVAYEFNGTTGEPGSGSYYPGIGGVAFWSENLPYHGETEPQFGCDPSNPMPMRPGQPFIMDTAYLYQDIYASWWLWSDATHPMWDEYMGYLPALGTDQQPEPDPYSVTEFNIDDRTLHGSYNSGCVTMPVLAMVPDCNGFDMVAVWSAMDEHHIDGAGNFYYKLFASYSGDGGRTWQPQIQLTTDFMYELSECVYTQAAVVGTTLVVACQMDGYTGTFVQGDDEEPTDNYYQGFTFELNDLFEGVGVPEVENHNTHMSVYPNPATDQIGIVLSQNADIVIYNIMGQVVMTAEGHAGANTLNISNLTSGIYFVNAGNETQKFIVK